MGENRKDLKNPLLEVNFYCKHCWHKFAREPERIEDAPERHHPYLYFAPCENCGREAEQANWEKGLMAAFGKSTGPKTPEGKAAVAENIKKTHTPENHARMRFNSLKTGLHATVLNYFPARPGQYPMCEGCEIRYTVCHHNTICAKEADRHMRYRIAFENKDYSMIVEDHAALHANVQAIINNIVMKLIQTGVEIHQPVWYLDKEGGFNLAEYTDSEGEQRFLTEVKAHPLLKVLTEFINKTSLSLSELGMTPRTQENDAAIKGHIETSANQGDTLLSYQERQTTALEKLQEMIVASQARVNSDPILIEHSQDEG